jgi:protein involved in polysaccharide export with SLBB domain
MRKVILLLSMVFIVLFANGQSTQVIEDLKQQVMTGQITPEEAIRKAKKMGLGKSQFDKMNGKAKDSKDKTVAGSGIKSLFLTSDYIEFPKEGGVDSLYFENTGKDQINWVINNREEWLYFFNEQDSTAKTLSGVLMPGERRMLKFGVKKPTTKEIPEEGLNTKLDIKASSGDIASIEIAWNPTEEKKDVLTYFGYDIFKGAYKAQLNDVGPSDNGYIVAPGDELTLNIWGEVEFQAPLVVSNDGTVFVDKVGQIKLAGESLGTLKQKLTSIMSRSFSSLQPKNGKARSFLDITLSKVTSFPVYIVGNVKKPGMVRVNSLSTAFSALFAAGGPKIDGSLREIQVMRNGKTIGTVDLYDYLTEGSLKSDIRLAPKDVVMVPYRKSSITIKGEINRPMIYELREKETLADLVRFAGGVKSTTDPSIVVINRLNPKPDAKVLRTMVKNELGKYNSRKMVINKLPIFDTDTVMLYAFTGKDLDQVEIDGAVYREGQYALTEDMTVATLLKEAGGLKEDVYSKKAELVRTLDDGNKKYFNINLEDEQFLKLKLENRDKIHIYSIWDLKLKQYVKVEGHVPNPGEFEYARNMRISDLIMKAGGLEDEFFKKNTYLERADIIRYNEDKLTTRVIPFRLAEVLAGKQEKDLVLEPGDKLIIYDASMVYYPKQVSIEGAVNNPGEYELQTNMTIKDIIVQAGGFQKSAYKSTIEVFRVDPFNITKNKLSSVKKIDIDPGMLLSFDKDDGFILSDRDIVVVRQYPNYEYQRKVHLIGEVKYPGTYTLLKEKETLRELIKRAGGLTNEAYAEAIDFKRDSMRLVADFDKVLAGKKKNDVLLHEGDTITIPRHPGTVKVEGYVNSPGIVQYRPGWSIKDYIEAAGDFTFEAAKGKAVVYYPGGNARKRRWYWSDPVVKEGSRIVVPKKPEREPTDWVDLTARIASIASSLATTIYIIDRK